jgi:hypothetical protein
MIMDAQVRRLRQLLGEGNLHFQRPGGGQGGWIPFPEPQSRRCINREGYRHPEAGISPARPLAAPGRIGPIDPPPGQPGHEDEQATPISGVPRPVNSFVGPVGDLTQQPSRRPAVRSLPTPRT